MCGYVCTVHEIKWLSFTHAYMFLSITIQWLLLFSQKVSSRLFLIPIQTASIAEPTIYGRFACDVPFSLCLRKRIVANFFCFFGIAFYFTVHCNENHLIFFYFFIVLSLFHPLPIKSNAFHGKCCEHAYFQDVNLFYRCSNEANAILFTFKCFKFSLFSVVLMQSHYKRQKIPSKITCTHKSDFSKLPIEVRAIWDSLIKIVTLCSLFNCKVFEIWLSLESGSKQQQHWIAC